MVLLFGLLSGAAGPLIWARPLRLPRLACCAHPSAAQPSQDTRVWLTPQAFYVPFLCLVSWPPLNHPSFWLQLIVTASRKASLNTSFLAESQGSRRLLCSYSPCSFLVFALSPCIQMASSPGQLSEGRANHIRPAAGSPAWHKAHSILASYVHSNCLNLK